MKKAHKPPQTVYALILRIFINSTHVESGRLLRNKFAIIYHTFYLDKSIYSEYTEKMCFVK